MDVAVLRVRFTGSTADLNRAFKRAKKQVKTFQADTKDVGKLNFSADTRSLKKANKDMETTSRTMGIMSGDSDKLKTTLTGLSGRFTLTADKIKDMNAVMKVVKIPFLIAALGGIAPAATSAAGAVGQLSIGVGQGLAGAMVIGGSAVYGAVAGLKIYLGILKSTVSASRTAYEATHEQAVQQLENRRNTILNTQASVRFNEQINSSIIRLTKFQAALGNRVFPMFTKEMRAWGPVLNRNQGEILQTAESVANTGVQFAKWFRTAKDGKVLDRTIGFINNSAGKGAVTLASFGQAGLLAFQHVIPYASKLQTEIAGLARDTFNWVNSSKGAETIGGVVAVLSKRFNQLRTIVFATGRGLFGVFTALNNQGGVDKLMSGLVDLSTGFDRLMQKGNGARAAIVRFMDNSQPALTAMWRLVKTVVVQFGLLANNVVKAGQAGGKIGTLAGAINGITRSVTPLRKLFQETFIALGPEIGPLITNIAKLAQTFAGSTGTLVTTVQTVNSLLRAFNNLPGPVKTFAAEAIAMNQVIGLTTGTSLPGLISSIGGTVLNLRLLGAANAAAGIKSGFLVRSVQALTLANLRSGVVAVGTTAKMVAQRVATIAINVATRAWAAGQWLLNAALTANPIGIVVVAIGALVAGLVIAYRRSETFRNIVNSLFGWLGKVTGVTKLFSGGLEGLKKRLTDTKGVSGLVIKGVRGMGDAWNWAKKTAGNMGDGVANAYTSMKNRGGKILGDFVDNTRKNFKDNEGISRLWSNKTRDAVASRYNDMKDRARKTLNEFVDNTRKNFKDNEGISRLWSSKTRDAVASRYNDMKERVGKILKEQSDNLQNRMKDNEGISRLWSSKTRDAVASRYNDMKNSVIDILSKMGSVIKNDILPSIRKGMEAWGNWLKDNMPDWFGSAVNGARNFLGKLAGAVAMVLEKLDVASDFRSGLSSAAKKLQEPIAFARGGVAQGPTGGVATGPRVVYGEAGPESYVTLKRYTPESANALRLANETWAKKGWDSRMQRRHGRHTPNDNHSSIGTQFMASGGAWYPKTAEVNRYVEGHFGVNGSTYAGHGADGDARNSVDWMTGQGWDRVATGRFLERGNKIVDYLLSQQKTFTDYIIWNKKMYDSGGVGTYRGGGGYPAPNSVSEWHQDHVHWESLENNPGPHVMGGGSIIDWIARAAGYWKDLAPDVPKLKGGWANAMIGGLGPKMLDYGWEVIKEQAQKLMDAVGQTAAGIFPGGSAGEEQARSWVKSGYSLANNPFPASTSNINKTLQLAWEESRWNPNAVNRGYTAGGGHPSGFLQMLPDTFNAHNVSGHNNIFDAVHNTASSLRYQKSRYGSPQAHAPYLFGGRIPGMRGVGRMVRAHAGERVLTQRQNVAFEKMVDWLSPRRIRRVRRTIDRASNRIERARGGRMNRREGGVGGGGVRDINIHVHVHGGGDRKKLREDARDVAELVRDEVEDILGYANRRASRARRNRAAHGGS